MRVVSFKSIAILALSKIAHSEHTFAPLHNLDQGLCDDTTWQNETNSASALVSDCTGIVSQLTSQKEEGFYLQGWNDDSTDEYLGLATSGTCIFGAKVINNNKAPPVIANFDIIDILNDAVLNSFVVEGRVGASGSMHCRASCGANTEPQEIGWKIYTH
ncbi:hypothetical protein E0Z10_g1625 [Xylaria hypoxylon]|uniref:Ecp2 effector protein-like domain-containing protein n=1 Tax=Xylaria hypoxylon TaxID=37992 RepID=A0A4Z0Z6S7_9PEZI|nr:hypothetical protein E0Z10_g1625 [Xylaria hypoxylon]